MTMYPLDPADAQAAMAAGARAADELQAPSRDPMGGATAMEAESTQQPYMPEDPGEPPEPPEGPEYGGVT